MQKWFEIGVIFLIMGLFLSAVDVRDDASKDQSVHTLDAQPKHELSQRISLNFQDIPVRSVLQLLADFAHVNVIVSDAVKGHVTLHVRKLPWKQAMDVILTMQGLEMRQIGDVFLIETAAVFHARLKMEAQGQAVEKKLIPLETSFLQINYAKAADLALILKNKTTSLISDRGSLSVDVRTNMIFLQDTATHIARIKMWLKHVDIPRKQVMIEARIVNMTKDSAYDLGVRWGVSKPSTFSGTQQSTEGTGQVPLTDHLNVDLAALPLEAAPASVGVALAMLGDRGLLDLELSALESAGKADIIARPRLMTTHQQAAIIESGEDIPYQESTSSGGTSVSFKKAVLRLQVTPQITPDGKLLLDLLINQDSDSGKRVQGVPVILTKSLQTHVLVKNGQTIVLGGIYKQGKARNVTRVPLLGKLFLIGYLFGRKEIRANKEELLVFVTPRIMENAVA